MAPVVLFILLLALSFGIMLYFLAPSQSESAIQRQLARIRGDHEIGDETISILKEERLSTIPWLNDVMKRVPGSYPLLHLIKQAGKTWAVTLLVLWSLVAACVAGLVSAIFLPIIGLNILVGIIVALLPFLYLLFLRETRLNACERLLPDAVDLMSRALRAGHAVTSALEMVGRDISEPLGSEFRTLYEQQSLGLPLREAGMGLVQRVPRNDIRFLATAILLQKETGGNLAYILDKTARVIRERLRLRGQVKVYTAQGRVTGWIICLLPFIMAGVITVVNPQYEKILLTDPLGPYLIYAGLAMMVTGVLIVRKIIRIRI